MTEISGDFNNAQTFDAKQTAEEIAAGEQKAPHVDVASDYEASKEFSVSEIDKTGEGAKAAEAATAPQFKVPEPESTTFEAESTGDPSDYLGMAKELSPSAGGAAPVTDELVDKALELGQPAE